MKPIYLSFPLLLALLISCKEQSVPKERNALSGKTIKVEYARGFRISGWQGLGHVLEIRDDNGGFLKWGLAEDSTQLRKLKSAYQVDTGSGLDATLVVPVNRMASNSTTHIAALEMLGSLEALSGFSNTSLISSDKARGLIESGKIKELGRNGQFDPEGLLVLRPELILTFGSTGEARDIRVTSRLGTPVMSIGEWREQTPLGRAEWLRVFGLLTGKFKESTVLFEGLANRYNGLKAQNAGYKKRPRVMSGSLFRDVFYAPSGNNWMAVLIEDAGGDYLWMDSKGKASLQLSMEEAAKKGHESDAWFGCGQFGEMEALLDSHPLVPGLQPVRNGRVYTYMNRRGSTGGVLFFEEAVFRPDWLLSDATQLLHGQPVGESLHYFTKLSEE